MNQHYQLLLDELIVGWRDKPSIVLIGELLEIIIEIRTKTEPVEGRPKE